MSDGSEEASMTGGVAEASAQARSLALSASEREALRSAMESYVTELRSEIGHTERYELREELKSRRMLLERVLRRLAEVMEEGS
jgi:hypothetical protein